MPRPLSELSPAERAVADLAIAERDNGRLTVAIGPFAAYLVAGALRSATEAPGIDEDTVRIGREIADSARHGMHWEATLLAEDLDDEADAIGPGGDPVTPDYVAHVAHLRDLEIGGQHKGTIELGPYSAFVAIGLLQLLTRHPSFGPGSFGHDVVVGFARQMQASYSPHIQDLIEQGFNPANDY